MDIAFAYVTITCLTFFITILNDKYAIIETEEYELV